MSDASVETPAFTSKNDLGLFKPDKLRTLPFTLAQKERFVTYHFIGCPRCKVAGARSKDVPGLAKIIAEKNSFSLGGLKIKSSAKLVNIERRTASVLMDLIDLYFY